MSDPRESGLNIFRKLVSLGIWRDVPQSSAALEDGKIGAGFGFPIIGLEKFLGYFDHPLNIANFPSISLTTDFSNAVAFCRYTEKPASDLVALDGSTDRKYQERAHKALSFFKSLYDIPGSFHFYIVRRRKYRSAKGLGESASVAAAVARSVVNCALEGKASESDVLVSRLARLVSGSGTRSATGGVSLWLSYPYIVESRCHAIRLPIEQGKIHYGTFPIPSEIATDDAHRLAESSPFYGRWMMEKFDRMIEDIDSGFDIDLLLKRSQQEMFTLNSVILSTGNFIQTPSSLRIIQDLLAFSKRNEGLYFTADTGPSIVLLSRDRHLIEEFISEREEKFLWGNVPGNPPAMKGLERDALDFFNRNG